MAETVLEVVIRARNEMTETLDVIKRNVDEIAKKVKQAPASPIKAAEVQSAADAMTALGKSADGAISSVEKLSHTVLTLGKAFIALEIVRWLKHLADLAVQDEKLEVSLRAVAISMGVEAAAAEKAARAVKALGLSTEATITSLTKYLRAGLPVEQFEQLARGAQVLAKATGIDAGSALERLTFALQTNTTRSLRWLGVQVDMVAEMRKYKEANPGAVIDQQTKSTVLLNAVLEKTKKLSEGFAGSQQTIASQLTQLRVQSEEAKSALGRGLLPIYSMLVEEGVRFAKNVQLISESLFLSDSRAREFAEGIRPLIQHFRHMAEFLVKHIELIVKLILVWGTFKTVVGTIINARDAYRALALAIEGLIAKYVALKTAMEAAEARRVAAAALANKNAYGMDFTNIPATAGRSAALVSAAFSIGITALIAAAIYGAKLISDKFDQLMEAAKRADARTPGKEYVKRVQTAESQVYGKELLIAWLAGILKGGLGRGMVEGAKTQLKGVQEYKTVKGELAPQMEIGLRNQLVAITADQLALADKLKQAEKDLNDALADRGTISVKEAQAKVEELEAESESLRKKREGVAKALEELGIYDKQKEAVDKRRAAEAKANAESQREMENIRQIMSKMKFSLDQQGGVDISTAARALFEDFDNLQQKMKESSGYSKELGRDFGFLAAEMTERMVKGVSTFDEIEEAMKRVASNTMLSKEQVAQFMATLADKRAASILKEIEEKTKSTTDAMKAQVKAVDDIADAIEKETLAAQENTEAFLRAGMAPEEMAKGMFDYTKTIRENSASIRELAQITLDGFDRAANAAKERYQREVDGINRVRNEQLRMVSNKGGVSQAEATQRILEVEKRANAERIASLQKYYDFTLAQEKKVAAEHAATIGRIKALDEELYQSKKSREEKITDIKTRGMSDADKNDLFISKQKTAMMEAQLAISRQDYVLAKRKNDEALAWASKVEQTGSSEEDLVRSVNNLYDQRDSILKKQRQDETALATQQEERGRKLADEVAEVADKLKTMLGKQVVDLQLTISKLPDDQIQTLRAQLVEGLKDIPITIKATPDASFNREGKFASGGLLRGPGTGTSDSIPIWASTGEFVVREKAVRHYGANFMELINHMHLPKLGFAEGGMVPALSTEGGTGARDMVDVNLNIGGKAVSLMGERTQVRKLVSTLKNLEGV